MNFSNILSFKYQNYIWSIGDTYESLVWDPSNSIPKPTLDQLKKDEAEMLSYKESILYREQRRQEYPAMGDQLDALLKQFESLRAKGENLDSDLDVMLDQWRTVKNKYPKPTGV